MIHPCMLKQRLWIDGHKEVLVHMLWYSTSFMVSNILSITTDHELKWYIGYSTARKHKCYLKKKFLFMRFVDARI